MGVEGGHSNALLCGYPVHTHARHCYNQQVPNTVSSTQAEVTDDMMEAMKGLNVLVAEDNVVNQLLIQRLLSSLGINSILVPDGQKVSKSFKYEGSRGLLGRGVNRAPKTWAGGLGKGLN